MPIGAETFVSAALQPLFERLFSLGEFVLAKLTSGGELAKTLKKWKRELRMIEAVLVDAEYQQYHNHAVKTWLEELQDLAYDMEDVLDHFATQLLAPRDEDAQGVLGINSMVTSITNNLSTLFNIAIDPDIQEKIDDITERLDEIKSRTHDLRHSATHIMQQSMLQTKALRDKRESSSLGSEVFGRDDKKQDIITQLLEGDHGDKNYAVIPIVGMGGIGKTTLAQYVYNDEQVKGHFELMAWVCVSNVFDVKRITTTIYKAAFCGGTPVDFSTLDEAQTQLKQVLISRKFLIVLDDIWNEKYETWDQLKEPLRHAPRGSRVIMTTRNKDIARMMNTDPSHNNIINLEGLSDKECWCVFQQHASSDSDLVELRDDVIKKCKGLPLAAKVLGSLLKKTVDKRRRRMILESDLWTNEENDVLPVLRLSYCLLPSHLKRIFAYCSLLPKDYHFTDMEVILLWMAQGFLPDNQPQSMEDLGQNYFDDLVSRSLFEQHPYRGGTFIMHDLVHDLALWAAGNICHVTGSIDKTQVVQNKTRHVFYTEGAATTLGSQFPILSQLRTFLLQLR